MADRPLVHELPAWWLAQFERAVALNGLDSTDLAGMLVPESATGRVREQAIKAARARAADARIERRLAELIPGES